MGELDHMGAQCPKAVDPPAGLSRELPATVPLTGLQRHKSALTEALQDLCHPTKYPSDAPTVLKAPYQALWDLDTVQHTEDVGTFYLSCSAFGPHLAVLRA